jgi:hypothetical protein
LEYNNHPTINELHQEMGDLRSCLGGVDPYTLTTLNRVLRKGASQGCYAKTHAEHERQPGKQKASHARLFVSRFQIYDSII